MYYELFSFFKQIIRLIFTKIVPQIIIVLFYNLWCIILVGKLEKMILWKQIEVQKLRRYFFSISTSFQLREKFIIQKIEANYY